MIDRKSSVIAYAVVFLLRREILYMYIVVNNRNKCLVAYASFFVVC